MTTGGLLVLAALAAGAQPVKTIDLSYFFLSAASGKAKSDPARCPGFVVDAFKGAIETCRDAGGKLGPAQAPQIWALDVNGDQKPEYLFELGANVQCDGATASSDAVARTARIPCTSSGEAPGSRSPPSPSPLTREITVRATPTPDGAVLARYGGDTEVVVLGEVTGTPYYLVSPCNACESGFIEKSAVRGP